MVLTEYILCAGRCCLHLQPYRSVVSHNSDAGVLCGGSAAALAGRGHGCSYAGLV